MKNLMVRANMLKTNVLNKLASKEKGVEKVVIILLCIAVVAGLLGAFYIWSKSTLLPAVEQSINQSIAQWFNPS